MSGWHGNSYGHSLASRGISVKQLKDIHYFPEVIDYGDPEEFIIAFWIASIKNDFSDYNFEKAFDFTIDILEDRLQRYGHLGLEKFSTNNDSNITILADDYINTYDWFAEKYEDDFDNDNYTKEMIEDIYKIVRKQDEPEYDFMLDMYNELLNPHTLKEKIFLMDKAIDLQHHRGTIWFNPITYEYLDIERLRTNFERDYRVVG